MNSRNVDSVGSLEVSSELVIQKDRFWLIKDPVYFSLCILGAMLSLADNVMIFFENWILFLKRTGTVKRVTQVNNDKQIIMV